MVDVIFWHIGGPVLFEKLTLNSFKYVRHPLLFRLWQKKKASIIPPSEDAAWTSLGGPWMFTLQLRPLPRSGSGATSCISVFKSGRHDCVKVSIYQPTLFLERTIGLSPHSEIYPEVMVVSSPPYPQ